MLKDLTRYIAYITSLNQALGQFDIRLCPIGCFTHHKLDVLMYGATVGQGPIKVLLTAGTHGEEQAAPAALLKFFQEDVKNYLHNYSFTIIPIINPTGFEKRQRRGSGNKDLNRYFNKQINFPENQIIMDFLKGKIFDHHLDMHEDIDIKHNGVYMYETGDSHCTGQILDKCFEFLNWIENHKGVVINKRPKIYGAPNNNGVIHRLGGVKNNAKLRKVGALVPTLIFSGISKRGTTLETSMIDDFSTRVSIQVAHLNFWLQSDHG